MAKRDHGISKEPKPISLALQGGGAHGAVTWGVLDRLLEEPSFTIEAISATSSGAINAAILISSLESGGKEVAKENLAKFWKSISEISSISPLQPNFFEKMMGLSSMAVLPMFQTTEWFKQIFAPYQFNFFDIYPLADVLDTIIDYRFIKQSAIKLYVNATNVKTGESKVFTNRDITDSKRIIASACLPYVLQNVRIGDEYYWDGCFAGNPSLTPLLDFSLTSDIVIVRILPLIVEDSPKMIPDIIDRADEISGNNILLNEMKYIELINKLIADKKLKTDKYRLVRLHSINNDEIMSTLNKSTKMNADLDFIMYLKDIGRQTADDWLKKSFDKIGQESSWRL